MTTTAETIIRDLPFCAAEEFGALKPGDAVTVDPKAIEDPPWNSGGNGPRLADLDDITGTAKDVGILQPCMARFPEGGGPLQLVFGARRRAAAQRLKIHLPIEFVSMSNAQARLANAVENFARVDPHPLDEAATWCSLNADGIPAEELGAKFGKSLATIYRRMALNNLIGTGKALYRAGKMAAGVAELLSRLPQAIQEEAVPALGELDIHQVRNRLEWEYLLRIASAPFSARSKTLLPVAGPCTTCPKNTGANRDLFEDMARDARCTDRACWRQKCDAHWEAQKATIPPEQIMPAEEVEKVFDRSGYVKVNGYVDGDAPDYSPSGEQRAKVDVLTAELGDEMPLVIYTQDPTGATRRLIREADLPKGAGKRAKTTTEAMKAERAAAKAAKALSMAVAQARREHVLAPKQAEALAASDEFWQLLANRLWHVSGYHVQKAILLERGWKAAELKGTATGYGNLAEIGEKKILKAATFSELVCLSVDVMAHTGMALDELEKLLGVDRKAIKAELAAAAKDGKKAKAARKEADKAFDRGMEGGKRKRAAHRKAPKDRKSAAAGDA